MSPEAKTTSSESLIERRRENVRRIVSSVRTHVTDFKSTGAFEVGLRLGIEETVNPLDVNYGMHADPEAIKRALTEDFRQYLFGVEIGKVLGIAHNIGSVNPVEFTHE